MTLNIKYEFWALDSRVAVSSIVNLIPGMTE